MYRAPILMLVVVCSFVLCCPAAAQQQTVTPSTVILQPTEEDIFLTKDMWGVGLYGGLLSGIGLSGRYHPMGRFGLQLTAGAMKFGELAYSFGAEGQFDFDSKGRSRFYGYLGIGYYYFEKKVKDAAGTETKENKLAGPARLGLGVAYEWAVSPKLIFNLNAAFTYFTDGTILPLPQAGLIYYFK
jgi:hypothetical protein